MERNIYTVYFHMYDRFLRFMAICFYRAMPRIRGTSRGPVSVRPCLSVCHKSVFYRNG